jgi:hypothetical protein
MTDDLVLLHHKLDLLISALVSSANLSTLRVLPAVGSGVTNSTCPVCKSAVKIAIYPSSGEIKRECGCNGDLGVRSLGPLPALPQPWAKRSSSDD